MQDLLTPQKALIFRITHRANLPWVLGNGLHCASSQQRDPACVSIGNPDLIGKRTHRLVPAGPGGTLSDYVPFYFTPRSPMLLNIKTGYNGIRQRRNDEIVVFVTSVPKLMQNNIPFVFTDRHAYLATARFFSDPVDLKNIDWPILQNSDFKRDNNDLGKMERYQAEALVHGSVPPSALLGVACYNEAAKAEINGMLSGGPLDGKAFSQPRWYF